MTIKIKSKRKLKNVFFIKEDEDYKKTLFEKDHKIQIK